MARPRSEEARRKALAAATDLIVERGVANLTIEEVAARSGVAKTTIYRHWPERASLIIDTVRATFEHVGTPDTGSLRGDLEAYFGGMVRADLNGKVGKIMPCLIDAAARDPEIELLLDRISVERQQPILTIVGAGPGARRAARRPRPAGRRRDDRRADRVPQARLAPAARRRLPRRLPRRGPRRPVSRALDGDRRTATAWPEAQPTEPSICSSIRRLHSTAYSIGRVRVIGSMKPLTTMPIACSSERPRLIR